MTPEFAYFLKVNVAFILLYAFYRLFFSNVLSVATTLTPSCWHFSGCHCFIR